MTWERQLLALFDDLEQQAEGLALAQRDAEVAELARAEYAEVELASRLHASVGAEVELAALGVGLVRGRLLRVGAGWCLVSGTVDPVGEEWVLAVGALTSARGLAAAARPEVARPVTSRLGLGSVLRGIAEARDEVVLVRVDGQRRQGRLVRVGADFLEMSAPDSGVELVPFAAVAACRPR